MVCSISCTTRRLGHKIVGCVVNHSYKDGEFVMHVPLTQVEYEHMRNNKPDKAQASSIIRSALDSSLSCELDILHVGFWTLSAAQAKSYYKGRVALCGDAAHSMPPAGGFGMNTGIEDAQNLAHKINRMNMLGGVEPNYGVEQVLKCYDEERRVLGRVYINQSVINYEKNLATANMLGLSASNLQLVDSIIGKLPFGNKNTVMGALKMIGTWHLDAHTQSSKLKDVDLLQLNFFDLETSHKVPITDKCTHFSAIVNNLKPIHHFEGQLLKHFKLPINDTKDCVGSKQVWSHLSSRTTEVLPYVLVTNIKQAIKYRDAAFIMLFAGDSHELVNGDVKIDMRHLVEHYVGKASEYIIVIRSDGYIESVMIN